MLYADTSPIAFASLKDLFLAALERFSLTSIATHAKRLPHSPASCTQPPCPEAQYGHELYSCMYKVLEGKAVIHSELSYTKAGRINFFLKQPGWGIEIFRDGDLLEQHVCRFTVGGAYHSWGIVNDYILLDFRTDGLQEKRSKCCLHYDRTQYSPV